MLTSLTFDRENYLSVGLADRTEWQSGNRNCAADDSKCSTAGWNPGPFYETLASGDIQLAAPLLDGAGQVTGYVQESGGKAGNRSAAGGRMAASPTTGEGPGGNEFYDDRWHKPTVGTIYHRENALGAVIFAPGTTEIASSSYDPLTDVQVVGVEWFSLKDGNQARGYQHTKTDKTSKGSNSFQKGGGMGGLTLLTKAAPIEIGNRVWLDVDGDGVQDADEPSIADAAVELYAADSSEAPTGNALATKTTDENGVYFFRSEDAATNGTPGFKAEGKYVVVFRPGTADDSINLEWLDGAKPSDFKDLKWSDVEATQRQVTSGDEKESAQRDSNPDADGKAPVIVGRAGHNDHTIDAGYKPIPSQKVSVGDFVWFDEDNDGIQGAGEKGIEGVVLTLTDPEGKPVTDVDGKPVGSVTTDKDGKYSFDNLPVLEDGQSYTVTIDQEKSAEALKGYAPTKTGVGERDKDSSTGSASSEGLTENGERDSTLDFGFVKPVVSVGDKVWEDLDRDGVQGEDEPGIPGVVLELKDPSGSKIGETTTDDKGEYSFDDLPVLKEGESYTVTVKDPEGFVPTKPGVGERDKDSSTGSASSEGLTENGERDSTLDFGYVRTGGVTVEKTVTGPKGDAVQKDPEASFQIKASWIDFQGVEQSKIINVTPGKPVSLSGLPLGVEITLSEIGAENTTSERVKFFVYGAL